MAQHPKFSDAIDAFKEAADRRDIADQERAQADRLLVEAFERLIPQARQAFGLSENDLARDGHVITMEIKRVHLDEPRDPVIEMKVRPRGPKQMHAAKLPTAALKITADRKRQKLIAERIVGKDTVQATDHDPSGILDHTVSAWLGEALTLWANSIA